MDSDYRRRMDDFGVYLSHQRGAALKRRLNQQRAPLAGLGWFLAPQIAVLAYLALVGV
jgi:hypothetical protein